MKLGKKILILLVILILALSLGCAKEEEPPKEEPPKEEQPPDAQQAVYVGAEKCYSCHSEAKEAVSRNSHGTAFQPLENYNIEVESDVIVYESTKEGEGKSIKLNEVDIVGVMSDYYVIGALDNKYYRLAAVTKENEQWSLEPAATKDVNNDGQEDWVYKDYTCGNCHSPGLAQDPERTTDLETGFSCETCHGPGSIHVTTKSKEAIESGQESCLNCHTASEPKIEGDILIAQNHYGTRSWFDSNHNSGKPADCLNCHTAHEVNAEGKMIKEDSAQELCSKCHGDNMNVDEIMWLNPTDQYNHFTKDHSFGEYPYDSYGDKPDTKPVEITKPETIEKMKKNMKK